MDYKQKVIDYITNNDCKKIEMIDLLTTRRLQMSRTKKYNLMTPGWQTDHKKTTDV
jgi:hypothetical protein